MQEPIQVNSDENNLQPTIGNVENIENTENNNNVPEYLPPPISIPQYSVPQYSVPQYTVPQYQEPEQNDINNIQAYQPPTYPSFNPEQNIQQQDANNQVINNQATVYKDAGGCPNSWELFSFFAWILCLFNKYNL